MLFSINRFLISFSNFDSKHIGQPFPLNILAGVTKKSPCLTQVTITCSCVDLYFVFSYVNFSPCICFSL